MRPYKISVVIPTYKPQDYVWTCLDSLYRQTLSKSDFEVIIVLNGCDEPWKTEILDYIGSNIGDMNVKFIHTDKGGVSHARNLGLQQALGKFVAFIDDDDYVSPRYLESLLEKSGANTVVLSNTIAVHDESMTSSISYVLPSVYKEYHKCNNINLNSQVRKYFSGPCMKLLPLSAIGIRRFDIRFKNGEDSLFMFLISDKIKKVCFAGEDAVYYRRFRNGSAVTSYRSLKSKFINSLKIILQYSKIYWSSPLNYNFIFYITRVLGAVRSIFS